jgi:hypothetical protein
MGSVKVKETSVAGEISSTIELEFSDASDYFTDQEYKREALVNAVKSYANAFVEEPMVADIQVTKKKTDTKH